MRDTMFTYDGSFDCFLSAIFDVYDKKTEPIDIMNIKKGQMDLFSFKHEVITDEKKAARVWNGIRKISVKISRIVYLAHLTGIDGIELPIFHLVKDIINTKNTFLASNFGNENVLKVRDAVKKILKEAGRIKMFTRFQKTKEGIYYSSCEPIYNALPLVIEHFSSRFADQQWIIYDNKRDYGFYYDLNQTHQIQLTQLSFNKNNINLPEQILDENEKAIQKLWKNYFKSICIEERKNKQLHIQLMPKRYWKFLIEKQP